MEKRTKCDVIPVWMFRELDAGAKQIIHETKTRIQQQQEKEIKKVREQFEDIAWNYVKGKKVENCFKYTGDRYYASFTLNSKIKKAIEKKQKALEEKVKIKANNQIIDLNCSYEKWKMNILTGKIPRSRVKGFEL